MSKEFVIPLVAKNSFPLTQGALTPYYLRQTVGGILQRTSLALVLIFPLIQSACAEDQIKPKPDRIEISPVGDDEMVPLGLLERSFHILDIHMETLQYDNPGDHTLFIEAYLYEDHKIENPKQICNGGWSVQSKAETIPLAIMFREDGDTLKYRFVTDDGSMGGDIDIRLLPDKSYGTETNTLKFGERVPIFHFGCATEREYGKRKLSDDPVELVKYFDQLIVVYAILKPMDEE